VKYIDYDDTVLFQFILYYNMLRQIS